MPYPAKIISDWFVWRASESGELLTQMKLQKLVYFAHGWHLAVFGSPLISERVEAWQWGPVVRSLYSAYARYGAEPIYLIPNKPKFTKNVEDLLEKIWQQYGNLSAAQLSAMTHQANTPWSDTFDESTKKPISDNLISNYFRTSALQKR